MTPHRRARRSALGLFVASVLVAACTSSPSTGTATTTASTKPTVPATTLPATTVPLLSGRYNAIAMTVGGEPEPLRHPVSIDFGPVEAYGRGPCNDVEHARWSIADGRLDFGGEHTFVGCDTEQDQEFIDLLAATPIIVFGPGGTITLRVDESGFGPLSAGSVTLTLSPTAAPVALAGVWASADGLPVTLRLGGQIWIDGCRQWLTESTITHHTLVITAIDRYPGPICDDASDARATATAFERLTGRFDLTLAADSLTLHPPTGPALTFHRP